MTWLLAFFVIFLAALNLGVCIAVSKSGRYTRTQVLLQLALVWLLPIFRAVFVALFLRSDTEPHYSVGTHIPPADVLVGACGDLDGGSGHAP